MSTEDLTVKIEVAEALVLKPGDRVLLKFSPDADLEDLERLQRVMQERFPDVTCTLLAADVEIFHQPAGGE